MKRLILAAAILLAVPVLPAVGAAEPKALVIIDSYFDSRVGVEVVCLSTDACKSTVKTMPKSVSDNANHGVGMVEMAQKNIGAGKIIALRMSVASSRSANDVTPADFIRALTWVEQNASRVAAVSYSRSLNGNGVCKVAAAGLAVAGYSVTTGDAAIRQKIANLKSMGIPVFVSTGNTMRAPVSYPACIGDTVSVSTGSADRNGNVASVHSWDATTDYFVSPTPAIYKSVNFGLLPATTSSVTAALAAKWVASGLPDGKFQVITP